MDDRKLHTVDFIERFMGVLAWVLACLQIGFVVYTVICAPYFITWQWIVQRVGLLATTILYGIFFSTSNTNFRPVFLAYGVCALGVALAPNVYSAILGSDRVFGEIVFTSYSLFEFLYHVKEILIWGFVVALAFLLVRSRGLVNEYNETCSLLMILMAIVGQIYASLYLLSTNVVLTVFYNCQAGYVALCLLMPTVYILYCCDESFGGVPTLS